MKLFAIAFKDLLRSSRSLFLVGMAICAPLLITGLIYFAFGSLSTEDSALPIVHVGVVNADTLPADAPLQAPLGDSLRGVFFDQSVSTWIVAQDYSDEASLRAALAAREIGAAVLIPANFTQNYLAGEALNPLTVLHDPTLSIAPAVVRSMLSAMLDGAAGGRIAYQVLEEQAQAASRPLDAGAGTELLGQYTAWYTDFERALFHDPERAALVVAAPGANPEADSPSGLQSMIALILAGQMIFFSFFTGGYAMLSILQESEEGTLARLFTTPTDRTLILGGKFLAVLLTVVLQGLVLMLAGRLFFKVDWGLPGSAALAFVGQMAAAVGLAVLLVALIKTSRQTGPIFGGALTALGMLSGLFTTNVAMPAGFITLSKFTPQGWALNAWKLTLAGQPAGELLLPCAVLLAMGAVMFVIGARLFNRRFA